MMGFAGGCANSRGMRSVVLGSLVVVLGLAPVAAPVTISVCSGGIRSFEFVEVASYEVTLRDVTTKQADEVRLSARYGRHERRATFDIKAAFAPGVDVKQRVRRTVNGGLYSYVTDENDCTIDYVHFTDGTSWNRPAP